MLLLATRLSIKLMSSRLSWPPSYQDSPCINAERMAVQLKLICVDAVIIAFITQHFYLYIIVYLQVSCQTKLYRL